jgi:hypothetical protein
MGEGVAVPRAGEARPVRRLEDRHPGGRVVHQRDVLQARVDVLDGERLPGRVVVSITVSSTGFIGSGTVAPFGGDAGTAGR